MKFGLFYLFSDFGHIAQDRLFHKKVMRSMELFAKEVMPEVRAASEMRPTAAR